MSYDEILAVTENILFSCLENPERLAGAPIGMYHCPWCGCMQLAGTPHTPHEIHCVLGLWDDWDFYGEETFWEHEQA